MLSLCIAILVFGFISGVYMETCPEEEDIYPCTCAESNESIEVLCSSDLSDSLKNLHQAFISLNGKNNVELSLKNFNISISSNLFSDIGIKKLYFMSCRMDSSTNDDQPGLFGLKNHLEELRIIDCPSVPAKLNLGHMKKLKRMELWRNNILQLGDDWLGNGPPSLEFLEFDGNGITKIGSNVFSKLNNLGVLSLNGNRFGPIKRSMLPTTADRLNALYFQNNALTDLPVDIFSRMPYIDHVSLYGNGITTLDEHTWSPVCQQLKSVNLRGNNIYCDERLNWIRKLKERPQFSGDCSAPKEFKGMRLEKFFKIGSE